MVLVPETITASSPQTHRTDHATIARAVNRRHGVATGAPADGQTYAPDLTAGETHVVTLPATGTVTIGAPVSSDGVLPWLPGAELAVVLAAPAGSTCAVAWDASYVGAPAVGLVPAPAVFRFRNTSAGGAPVWILAGGTVPPPAELGYISLATSVAAANATDTAAHDVTGLQLAFTAGARPVKVRCEFMVLLGLGTLGTGTWTRINGYLQQINADTSLTQRDNDPMNLQLVSGQTHFYRMSLSYRFQPVPGTVYTFKAQLSVNHAGAQTGVYAEDLGVESYIEALQR